jgi:hypothetical protein
MFEKKTEKSINRKIEMERGNKKTVSGKVSLLFFCSFYSGTFSGFSSFFVHFISPIFLPE